jgi:hypothetical protein
MKISRKNWESSKEKWAKILKNIRNRNKIRFDSWNYPCFYDVEINVPCGYCSEFWTRCPLCSLNKKSLCSGLKRTTTPFYACLVSLRNSNYSTALKHAKKIYKAIMEDEVNVYKD